MNPPTVQLPRNLPCDIARAKQKAASFMYFQNVYWLQRIKGYEVARMSAVFIHHL
jgi:hypothetical protein